MVTYYTYEDMKELLDRAMWEIGISRAIADHESSGDDLMVQENGEYLDLDGNQSSIQKIEVRVHEQGCPVRRCEMRYDTEKKIMSFDSFNEKGERLDNYSLEAQTDDHWSAEKNFFWKAEGIKKARENAAEQNGGKRVEEPPFYYTYDEMEALLYRAMGEMGIPFGDYDSLFEGNELMIGEDGEYQDLDGNQSDRQELSIDLDEEGCPIRECQIRYDSKEETMIFESFNEAGNKLEDYSLEAWADDHQDAEKNFFQMIEGVKAARERVMEPERGIAR